MDLIPALEQVRTEGVQICLDAMYAPIHSELGASVDIRSTQVVDKSHQRANNSDSEG